MNLLPYWLPVLPIPTPVEVYVIPCRADGFVPEYANCHLQAFRAARMARDHHEIDESFFKEIARLSYTWGL